MRLPFNGTFRQTQGFGGNKDTYIRFGLNGHNGLDFATPNNTPLYAPISGTVKEATMDEKGYGNYVKIENDKEGALVAHLRSYVILVGQQVSEGQFIGYSDNTGFSSGPHLHFGYYRIPRDRQNGYLGYINPEPYLNSTPLPIPPKPTMTDIEKKKLVQFDRAVIALNAAGIISSAASEQFFDNPQDEDKFTNLIKRLIRDQNSSAQVAEAYEKGRKAGVRQVQDVVAKQV